ncbi:MAG TPA: acetyl-CoA C-acyltransferase [Gemmatimonadaceae bacterium]|jgi:acetyl-CoA C-acetyltransferase
MSLRDAVIVDALRTPRGRGRSLSSKNPGALAGVHPQELVAQILNALADRTGLATRDVDDLILGCVTQVDDQSANIARHAVLTADWPVTVPATTLTRACGSGLQALHYAVTGIASGVQNVVVAGGVESMSRVTMGSDRREPGGNPDRSGVGDGGNERLRARIRQVPQGISADIIATLEGMSREEVDAFALASQTKAAAAIADCRFANSLVPVRDPETGALLLDHEEFPRPTTAQGLAALPAAFAALGATLDDVALSQLRARLDAGQLDENSQMKRALRAETPVNHVHTAGNSSGIADGAAAVLVASAAYAQANGLCPRARIRSMAALGSDPILMLTAPTTVSRKALASAGMDARDVDLWEINEAFAVVPLKTIRDLSIDPDRVNVNGGSIALGHPLGATGAILVGTALDELERRGLATALVTLCIAGGQGIAAVIERI